MLGEEIYPKITDHISDGVLVHDAETGRVLYANPALETLSLYSTAELRKITPRALNMDTWAEEIAGSGSGSWHERKLHRKDGSLVRVEVRSSPIRYSGRRAVCVLVRSAAREEIEEERPSELFARSTMDSLSAHIAILDEAGTIIATNRAWRKFAEANGADPARVSEGASYLRICGTATGPNTEQATTSAEGIRSVLAGERKSFELEYPCHSPTERRWFIERVTRFSDTGPPRAVVAHENITERKLAEEALQDQKVLLETILNQAADAIVVCDDKGRLTFVNAAARRLASLDPEGASLDMAFEVWGVAHYPDGSRIAAEEWPVPRALRGETTVGTEARMARPDGSHYDVLISAAPLKSAEGEIIGAVASLVDITERKRMEEESERLRIREIESRTQREERRRIARDLHDVVLQDLSGALQSLRLTHLRSKGSESGLSLEEDLEALKRATSGLRSAIHDLRHEQQRPFMQSAESLIELNCRLAPETEIELSVEEQFPEELGAETRVELLRVLQEALANVRRHSGARNVELGLRAQDGYILAEVSDDGRGFEPEVVGWGVGLSAMRERVEGLGGELKIRSRPGEGTAVLVRVPSGDDTLGPRR